LILDFSGKKVLVLGLGETGLSMAKWLTRKGARVAVADTRAAPPNADGLRAACPQATLVTGAFSGHAFAGIDLIAISPGVPLAEPEVRSARMRGVPVIGDIELFAQALGPRCSARLVGITGSNGKTTVTAMAGAMCRKAGLRTRVAGNIGPAVLDALMDAQDGGEQPEVWVLELSSFQLETMQSLDLDAAAMLNLSEDHFDRYTGMADYAKAKARIFQGRGTQILNRDDPASMAMRLPGRKLVTFGVGVPETAADWGVKREGGAESGTERGAEWLVEGDARAMKASVLKLAGRHNLANALAALALTRSIGLPLAPLAAALAEFEGLPHRMQLVATLDGVAFFDDSKGTNVGATVAALLGLEMPVVLIAGGEGKGQDFAPLASAVAAHARAVVLIGRDAPLIEVSLAATGVPLVHAKTMSDAVDAAFAAARPGDAVLLSPACASFDMFRNYPHRAEVFVAAVNDLGRRIGDAR
jgi:UDP-N-acetylmuramoylalanine--D-glutamate ligase